MTATHDDEADAAVPPAEWLRVRDRVHKLADTVQAQTLTLAEHALMLRTLEKDQAAMLRTMATSEQLANRAALIDAKLDSIREMVEPIRRGINWAIGLVLTAVIVAVLSLIIKSH